MLRRRTIALVAVLVAACGSSASTAPTTSSPPSNAAIPSSHAASPATGAIQFEVKEFDVPPGSHPHDVAPATDGGVWYTGQHVGTLGHLDPSTGEVRQIELGNGSAPHGVIVGPDGAPWITDGGLNAIVHVDPETDEVTTYPLPADRPGANLNTAAFDGDGILWFTGQSGIYGRVDPASRKVDVFDDPDGRGPYGMDATPGGDVWDASLAGSHLGVIDSVTGGVSIVEPPTANQGARRVWSDSKGRLWVAEWNAGQVGLHDPSSGAWKEWKLPGSNPQAYAVYVDERDIVWLTDFGANAIVRFDPVAERFDPIELPSEGAAVRQLLGRPGELWGAESAVDKLVLVTER